MIEAALAAIEERDKAIAHEYAVPVSLLGQSMCSLEGVKEAKTAWFNPHETRLKRKQGLQQFGRETAQVLLQLSTDGKLPSWALEFVDVDLLRLAAED